MIKAITAQNKFTNFIQFGKQNFNVSIWGTFVATITVQRSFDERVTWLDVQQFTEPGEWIGITAESFVYWRVGVKTGDFISGTVNVRMGG